MSRDLTRRGAMTSIAAMCCGAGAANAGAPTRVDQITDPGVTPPRKLFRFEPDFLRVDVGESVAFLNSRADHTVHSAFPLWPEAAPKVGISNRREAVVTFPVAGVYAFRCRRHAQYGMVMIVVAGDGEDLDGVEAKIDAMRARRKEKDAFRALVAGLSS